MNAGIQPQLKELVTLRHYAPHITLLKNNKINTQANADHVSIIRGRGMDFDEVRRYQFGDDIRLMSWKITARLGNPYIKLYKEEKQQQLYLLIDQSLSMQFGTRVCFKSVLSAKLAAIFGWAALSNNTKLGGIIFRDQDSAVIDAKSNQNNLFKIFNNLINYKPNVASGGLDYAIKNIYHQVKQGAIIIIFSDYMQMSKNCENLLRLLSQNNTIINILTYDQLEYDLPNAGEFTFSDNDNHQFTIKANNHNRQLYQQILQHRLTNMKRLSQQNHMKFITIKPDDNLLNWIKQNGV
jgi:uncharacterized protein (DUF58 family)